MAILIEGLDHVVLRVLDLQRALTFYRDVLGCSLERELPEVGLVQLRAGSSLIDLVPVNSKLGRMGGAAAGQDGHNMDHFCLRLASFDGELIIKHLARHGIASGGIERRYGAKGYGPSLYLSDPDGNQLELKGPPEQ